MDDDDENGDDDDVSSIGEQSIGIYIERAYKYLGHDRPIALDEHRKAVVSLRKACLSNQLPDNNSVSRLIFTSMALLRRIISIHGVVSDYEHSIMCDDEDVVEAKSFQRTLTLTFLLIARVESNSIAERDGAEVEPDEYENDSEYIKRHFDGQSQCLWKHVIRVTKKRCRLRETDNGTDTASTASAASPSAPVQLTAIEKMDIDKLEVDELVAQTWNTNSESSTWSTLLFSSQDKARESLRLGGLLVRRGEFDNASKLDDVALAFTRATTESFQSRFLCQKDEIMSLHSATIDLGSNESIANLKNIISTGDSESGMMAFRDLLCSFLLPLDFIGKRRNLLICREVSTRATREHAHVVALAHDCAMGGISAAFDSCNELKATCAILAGVAMLTTSKEQDLLRKSVAFDGIVSLPFLESPQLKLGMRLTLVLSKRIWVLYSLSKNGSPIVHVAKRGFDGLATCVLVLMKNA